MPTYHLSLGSNQGDRLAHLQQAATGLAPHCTAIKAAPIYETEPIDCPTGSSAFFNTVLRVNSVLSPAELHRHTQALEQAAGRSAHRARNAPRPLDIDILLTSAVNDAPAQLEIPHPRLHERRFVLQPLHDLEPTLAAPHLPNLSDAPESVRLVQQDWLPFEAYPLEHFAELPARKRRGPRLSVLTAYDYPTARLLDEAGVDMLLVGDSLGMVVLGLPDTTHVTMDHMLHHLEAVARGAKRARIIGDLPYRSYRTAGDAVVNARRLMDAGAHAVKLEGGTAQRRQIDAIIADGIPLIGHIGMLPQSILEEGGRYKKKGKTATGAAELMADAQVLADSGALGIVVESVVADLAAQISRSINIPTIGIGSGTETDGQVLVVHDLIGAFPWFRPPFAKTRADIASAISFAADGFIRETHCLGAK